MKAKELAQRLAQRAEDVARHLLPEGRKQGAEWLAGSVGGEAGKSLGVRVAGTKAGVWADFSCPEHSGDLLDLWMAVRGMPLPDAMAESARFVGIELERSQPRTFPLPKRPAVEAPKDDVLAWLTVTRRISDEAIKAYRVGAHGEHVVFPHLRNGTLANFKLRSIRDKRDMKTAAGCEQMLWGWQAVDPKARSIVLAEGELDAMSLWDYGRPALSVFSGAGNLAWLENEYDNLARFDDIYLCMDDDEAGRAGTEKLLERLGRERCLVVTLPKKDANECRTAGVTREQIDNAFANARTVPPSRIKSGAEYRGALLHAFHPADGDPVGIMLPWPSTFANIALRSGELSVWTGISGHRKSIVLGQVMLEAARQGERVCIASMEMQPVGTLKRMARQALGFSLPDADDIESFADWMEGRVWLYDFVGSVETVELLKTFAYMRRRYGVTQFVIDSLMMLNVSSEDLDSQTETIRRILEFRSTFDCHVHLVAHARKGMDESKAPRKLDVAGSANIINQCDNVFSVWRNKPKEEHPEQHATESDTILYCDKQRNGEWEGAVRLWFDGPSLRFRDRPHTAANEPSNFRKDRLYVAAGDLVGF